MVDGRTSGNVKHKTPFRDAQSITRIEFDYIKDAVPLQVNLDFYRAMDLLIKHFHQV